MSAYKEKMIAIKHLETLAVELNKAEGYVEELKRHIAREEEYLADAEQDIKWEAQNDRR